MRKVSVDPISVEVIQNALVSFIREMRVTIIRTAFGPVIWETHDFSCGLLAPDGDLLALSEDNPVHIVPTMYSVPAVRERFGDAIAPGDIFVINDPYRLGTHMNDVAHLYPFFVNDELTFWIVVRVHYPDIGGMAAGSITPDATEVYQEGLFFPPLKIYDRGKPNEVFTDIFFANVRVPEERRGDFMAVMGAFWTGDKRLRQIVETFGREEIIETNRIVRDRAERTMIEAIRALPEGTFSYELNLDSNGVESGWVPLRVVVEVKHKPEPIMVLDFSDSAPPVPGPMNGAPATAACAAFTAIKSFLDPMSQTNGGSFRPLKIVTKPGTIFEATPPMAMCGSLDLGYRVMELVMGALATIRPDNAVGDHSSCSHLYLPVYDPVRKRPYVFYEMPIGGTGAVSSHDGSDAVAGFERGDFARISSVEIWEHQVPFQAVENTLIPDTGGAGKFRGGLGMRRSWRLLEKSSTVSDLSEPCLVPGYGVLGAFGGKPSTCSVRRNTKRLWPGGVTGTGKATRFPLLRDDVVTFDKWGGGGYGDPLDRDPDHVLHDLREGYISAERAENLYGIVVHNDALDLEKTKARRQMLTKQRVVVSIEPREEDCIERGTRIFEIGSEIASQLKIKDGIVLELVNPHGASLRGKARIDSKLNGSRIPLGPLGRRALESSNDGIWIREVLGVLYVDHEICLA